jgi:hypothetical protein
LRQYPRQPQHPPRLLSHLLQRWHRHPLPHQRAPAPSRRLKHRQPGGRLNPPKRLLLPGVVRRHLRQLHRTRAGGLCRFTPT